MPNGTTSRAELSLRARIREANAVRRAAGRQPSIRAQISQGGDRRAEAAVSTLRRRLARLEGANDGQLTVLHAIDRPPQETREQWLARVEATSRGDVYEPGAVNSLT